MNFRIFTLHPDFFESFKSTSLIARGIEKKVINIETVNWRDDFGIGNYKQVDDKPFGGGNGMVLMAEPIVSALEKYDAVSQIKSTGSGEYKRILPNNAQFWDAWQKGELANKKVTISLTPRGFPINQQIIEWLADSFDETNIICGRYEGFDSRVSDCVDLELSIGDFVLNGGEAASICLIEAISRLRPGFITKEGSVLHDSFSSNLNQYNEHGEYVFGKQRLAQSQNLRTQNSIKKINWQTHPNLFDNDLYMQQIAPKIEHPQFTRPQIWREVDIPKVLTTGDHKKIQKWRENWYKKTPSK